MSTSSLATDVETFLALPARGVLLLLPTRRFDVGMILTWMLDMRLHSRSPLFGAGCQMRVMLWLSVLLLCFTAHLRVAQAGVRSALPSSAPAFAGSNSGPCILRAACSGTTPNVPGALTYALPHGYGWYLSPPFFSFPSLSDQPTNQPTAAAGTSMRTARPTAIRRACRMEVDG